MNRKLVRVALIALISLGGTGCAITPAPAGPASGGGRVVHQSEMVRAGARDAWDALRLLTPAFAASSGAVQLRYRGATVAPLVLVDGARAVDATVALRSLPVEQIASMQFFGSVVARSLFGPGTAGGAIVVRTGPAA